MLTMFPITSNISRDWYYNHRMSWLFSKKAKKVAATPKNALECIDKQLNNINNREKVLDKKMHDLIQDAVKFKKEKKNREAILALKKKKMLEGEFNKIAGMRLMLEQQKVQVDAAGNDIDIFKALKEGNEFIKENIKSVNINSFEDLKDQLEDQQEQVNEINDFFGNVAKEGDDEIMEELEKLEADNVKDGT